METKLKKIEGKEKSMESLRRRVKELEEEVKFLRMCHVEVRNDTNWLKERMINEEDFKNKKMNVDILRDGG